MDEHMLKKFHKYIEDYMGLGIPVSSSGINRVHSDIAYRTGFIAEHHTGKPVKKSFNIYTKRFGGESYNGDPYVNETKLDRCIRKMTHSLMPVLNNNANDTDFILEFLQDPRVDVTMGDNSATKWAIDNNNMVVSKYLLSIGKVVDTLHFHVLLKHACKIDSPDMVNMLIEDFDIDVSRRNSIRVRVAIRDHRYEVFRALVSSPKFVINESIGNIFFTAISVLDARFLDTLLSIDSLNLKLADCDLVHYAVSYNNKYAVSKLLRMPDIAHNMSLATKFSLVEKKFIPTYTKNKIIR